MNECIFNYGTRAILYHLSINPNLCMERISRRTSITYSHVVRLIQKLEKLNLVKTERGGRSRFVTLTQKGLELANKFKELEKLIKECEKE